MLHPVRAEMLLEERRHLARDPGRRVHAVGDRGNWQLVERFLRPDRRPHRPRDLAVQLADGVDRCRRPQRQRGHVELRAAAVVVFAEREEARPQIAERAPTAGQVLLHHMEREGVMPRRHRRMRREDRRPTDLLERLVERLAVVDELADALQDDEAGVPFVQVEHRRRRTQRAQDAHAANAEDDLLLDAHLAIAAVEAGRELAIPGRVLLEVGVEQIELARVRGARATPPRAPIDRRAAPRRCTGWPSGVVAGSIGASAQFSFSYDSSCQPSADTCWWK